ncbi:hypothetical protein QBC43DRAFT_305457 [Cladorrhinum sp. PSN259]|nr:hypothetical protein QBC43DRAFT_305457 [Cladorrhinum sp. PSN259]
MCVIPLVTYACGHRIKKEPEHCKAFAGDKRHKSFFNSPQDCGKVSNKQFDAVDRCCSEKCAAAMKEKKKERLMQNARSFAERQQAGRQKLAEQEKRPRAMPYETRLETLPAKAYQPPPSRKPAPAATVETLPASTYRPPSKKSTVPRAPPPLKDRPLLTPSPALSPRKVTNTDRNRRSSDISRSNATRVAPNNAGVFGDPRNRYQPLGPSDEPKIQQAAHRPGVGRVTGIPEPSYGSIESTGGNPRRYRESTGSSLHTIPLSCQPDNSSYSRLKRTQERPPAVPPKDGKYLTRRNAIRDPSRSKYSAVPKPLFSSRPGPSKVPRPAGPPGTPPPIPRKSVPKAPSIRTKSSSGSEKPGFFRRLFGRSRVKREASFEWVSKDAKSAEKKGKGKEPVRKVR